ncbi:MAG: LysM peptidoglycan-binding domain-containing protein [Anaerolineae bacterium]|nr:LysM peptidoglycan-binding domain-containing protein [Anaerolineae bacterium]
MSSKRFPRKSRSGAMAVILILALALLAAGCSCGVSEAEPTAAAQDASTPAVAATTAPPAPAQTATPVIEGPTLLLMEPSVVLDFGVGETRVVQMMIENVDGLNEIEVHVSFEPRYVNIDDGDPGMDGVQVRPGDMPVPTQVIRNEVNNDAGLFIYHVAQEPGSGVQGTGVVASFTLRAMAEGGSPLRFNVVELKNTEGQVMPVPERINGLVTIGVSDVPVEPTAETLAEATEVPAAAPTTAPAAPTAPSASGTIYHTVRAGENLYRIAQRYGTTVEAIMAANSITDAHSLRVGQVLLIPVGGGGTTGTGAYVVQPGDTLYSIAKRFGTTVETLAALNGLAPPYTIKVGQSLVIP